MHAKQTLNTCDRSCSTRAQTETAKTASKHENITENNNGQLAGKTEGSIDFVSGNRPQSQGSRERG